MDFCKLARTIAPIAAIAFAAALSGCESHVSINGEDGKKLSELDLTGAAPAKLVLAGPDHVVLTTGDKLAIAVEGDQAAAEELRFTRKGDTLGILRRRGWSEGPPVTVKVTMPAPGEITLAGSGSIEAPVLGKDPKVTIAGSGDLNAGTVGGDSLELTVAGSGNMRGGGAVKALDLTIAGSGNADLAALRVDTAKVTVAGSGSAAFASDGNVSATIMGAGTVRVKGRATCKVSSMGSGKLVCESGEPTKTD